MTQPLLVVYIRLQIKLCLDQSNYMYTVLQCSGVGDVQVTAVRCLSTALRACNRDDAALVLEALVYVDG